MEGMWAYPREMFNMYVFNISRVTRIFFMLPENL